MLRDLCAGDTHSPVCVYVWDPSAKALVGFISVAVRTLVELCSQDRWLPARCRRCHFEVPPPALPESSPAAAVIIERLRASIEVADNRKGLFTYAATFAGSDLVTALENFTWCRPRSYGDTTRHVALDVANYLLYDGWITHVRAQRNCLTA